MKKRLFSILTALCLCLTLLPTAALAADQTLSVFTEQDHVHEAASRSHWEHDETEHWQVCAECGATFKRQVHQNTEGIVACGSEATCIVCGAEYGVHNWGEWNSNNDGTHTRTCSTCTTAKNTNDCSGGTATCTKKAECKDCGAEYGELGAHSFTKETMDAKYLKSAATCTEKAVYYKSCAVCRKSSEGTAEEETFERYALGHDWDDWKSNGDGTHTHVCQNDNTHTETANCSFSTATCTKKATCADCGAESGEINSNNHGNMKHVEAKAATTSEEGNIEYWHCEACGKYFSDAAATKEIALADTVTPKRQSSGGSSSSSYPVTAPAKTENGSVTVSSKNASKGTTVTITVKPQSGYTLETITVIDKNGNELKLTDKGNGQYSFTMPDGKVEVKATFMEDNSVLNFFYDVPNDAYYYEAVKWAVEKGVTGGVGNDLFAPNRPCTRAQIVTFLWRAAGSPVVNYAMNMADVAEDAYYAEAVRWALSQGITTGTSDGKFSPDAACTRAQAVAFLFRSAVANGLEAVTLQDLLSGFEDAASVPGYAVPAMNWALSQDIVKGSGAQLLPGGTCTRAQIVTFLWRAFSK